VTQADDDLSRDAYVMSHWLGMVDTASRRLNGGWLSCCHSRRAMTASSAISPQGVWGQSPYTLQSPAPPFFPKTAPSMGSGPHLIHDSLGSSQSTTQTASQ